MTNPSINDLIDLFTRKAEAVSAVVRPIDDLAAALDYAVEVCVNKEACQLIAAGCEEPLSEPAGELCDDKQQKTLAAPNLPAEAADHLAAACEKNGLLLVTEDCRRFLAGMDVGLTVCDFGVAETGSVVVDSTHEDLRLSTMISEVHVAVLKASTLVADSFDLAGDLSAMQEPPAYTAFITGASRTADIERVLALGVHGPLEMHVLIWRDI
jgi:L-lactate dehydrogenase complex protein LldG